MNYRAQIAKSNRRQCHETSCKQNIGVGELCVGYPNDDLYHPPCLWKAFTNRYILKPPIKSVKDIDNFDELAEEHQLIFRQLIDGNYQAPPSVRSNTRPKRGSSSIIQPVETEPAVVSVSSIPIGSSSNDNHKIELESVDKPKKRTKTTTK